MGLARSFFGWIFILYGLYVLIGNLISLTGISVLQFTNPTDLIDIGQDVFLPPQFLFVLSIIGFLWGALWIWIGNKIRTGGQRNQGGGIQVQRFRKK